MTRAQDVLSKMNINYFYTVGVGPQSSYKHLDKLNDKLSEDIISDSFNGESAGDLSSAFDDIIAQVTDLLCTNVVVTDTLSSYVEPVEGTGLTIEVRDGNGNVVDTPEGITAQYVDQDGKTQIQFRFPSDYQLESGYTYFVTAKIKATDFAYTQYQQNGNNYGDMRGDEYTDENTNPSVPGYTSNSGTSSNQQGFYANDDAIVEYVYNGERHTEYYKKPVIQISEDKLDNLEPVNFYLNLSSTIADTSGEVENQEAKYFTESVSGKKSGINTDLVMKLPKTHNHKEIFDDQPVDENGNKIQVGVIAGDSDTSAKDVDEIIRNLETGTPGNQEGYNDPSELYQIVNAQKLGAFPDDGDIFEYIRTNWNTGYKVNKGQDITVNGIPIDVQNLTKENFSIRWYVVKDDVTDCWHIDGVLVPKSGILNVTKTFSNQEIANRLSDTFSVTVTGNFLDTKESTVRLPLNEAEEVTTNSDGSVTYTWPSLAVFEGEYKIAEEGYGNERLAKWEYVDTDYVYKNASNAITEGSGTSVTIDTEKTEADSDPKIQSFAFTNNYQLKTTNLDLVKTSKNSNEPITGAIFKLSKKVENGWVEVQLTVSVFGTGEPELQGLVTGQTYKLEEIQAPEAHVLLDKPIYFTVVDGKVQLCDANGNTNSGTDNMWSLNTEGNVLTIRNNILYSLPEAGGSGIYWYTVSGALLMMGAALIVYREKRKREVLLRK